MTDAGTRASALRSHEEFATRILGRDDDRFAHMPRFARAAAPRARGTTERLVVAAMVVLPAISAALRWGNSGYAARGPSRFDAVTLACSLIHWTATLAWTGSVLVLVLANRLCFGPARVRLVAMMMRHFGSFAIGGLLASLTSGLVLSEANPLGSDLWHLQADGVRLVYLLVFVAKIVVVAAALTTSWRIARRLRTMQPPSWRLRPTGAGHDHESDTNVVLRLAETNAAFAAAILIFTVVLSNAHSALL